MGVAFLSEGYRAETERVANDAPALQKALGKLKSPLTLQYVLTDAPRDLSVDDDGTLHYWVTYDVDGVSIRFGQAPDPQFTFRVDFETAVLTRTGRMNGQMAMVQGKMKLEGPRHKLFRHAALMKAFDDASQAIEVDYPDVG